VKFGKKLNPKRETAGQATVQGLELGAIAIAIAIVILVPVVLDPARDYSLPKFEVLMGLCAPLLVAMKSLLSLI
jgi:hypothetical protein